MSDKSQVERYSLERIRKELASDDPSIPYRDQMHDALTQIDDLQRKLKLALESKDELKDHLDHSHKAIDSLNTHIQELHELIQEDINDPKYKLLDAKVEQMRSDLQRYDDIFSKGEEAFKELEASLDSLQTIHAQINADDSCVTRYRKRKIAAILLVVQDTTREIGMSTTANPLSPRDRGNLRLNFYGFRLICCKLLTELAKLKKCKLVYCGECHQVLLLFKQTLEDNLAYAKQNFFTIEQMFPSYNKIIDTYSKEEFKYFAQLVGLGDSSAHQFDPKKVPELKLPGDRKGDSRSEGGHFCIPVTEEEKMPTRLKNRQNRLKYTQPQQQPANTAQTTNAAANQTTTAAANQTTITSHSTTNTISRPRSPDYPDQQANLGKRTPLNTEPKRREVRRLQDNVSPYKDQFQAKTDAQATILQKEHQSDHIFNGAPNFSVKYHSKQMNKFEELRIQHRNYKEKKTEDQEVPVQTTFISVDDIVDIHLISLKPDRNLPTSNQSETFSFPQWHAPAEQDQMLRFNPNDSLSVVNCLNYFSLPKKLFVAAANLMDVEVVRDAEQTDNSEDFDPFLEDHDFYYQNGVLNLPLKDQRTQNNADDNSQPSQHSATHSAEPTKSNTQIVPEPIQSALQPSNSSSAKTIKTSGRFDVAKMLSQPAPILPSASELTAQAESVHSQSGLSTQGDSRTTSTKPNKSKAGKATRAKPKPKGRQDLPSPAPSEQKPTEYTSRLRGGPRGKAALPTQPPNLT